MGRRSGVSGTDSWPNSPNPRCLRTPTAQSGHGRCTHVPPRWAKTGCRVSHRTIVYRRGAPRSDDERSRVVSDAGLLRRSGASKTIRTRIRRSAAPSVRRVPSLAVSRTHGRRQPSIAPRHAGRVKIDSGSPTRMPTIARDIGALPAEQSARWSHVTPFGSWTVTHDRFPIHRTSDCSGHRRVPGHPPDRRTEFNSGTTFRGGDPPIDFRPVARASLSVRVPRIGAPSATTRHGNLRQWGIGPCPGTTTARTRRARRRTLDHGRAHRPVVPVRRLQPEALYRRRCRRRGAAEQAATALQASGFAPDDVRVVLGQQVLSTELAYKDQRGVLARLAGLFPAEEKPAVKEYVQEAESGAVFLVVRAPEREQRTLATGILAAHGGHAMRYYGEHTITDLQVPQV